MRALQKLPLLSALFFMCAVYSFPQDRARSASSQPTFKTATHIPAGSSVYIAEIDGFENFDSYLIAAFKKKKVPLLVVTRRDQADFEITGYSESRGAGWAKVIFGSGRSEETASIKVINLKTGVVAYAVSSYRTDAWNGKKSTAEHLAKNLAKKIKEDANQ